MVKILIILALMVTNVSAGVSLLHTIGTNHYFTDDSGKAVYLCGKHNWPIQVQNNYFGTNNSGTYNYYANYIATIGAAGQNFMMVWPSDSLSDSFASPFQTPMAFGRSSTPGAADGGNKYDLTTYNDSVYFPGLSNTIALAGTSNIYVSVRLFDGYRSVSPDFTNAYWPYSVFNTANNVNGTLANLSDLWTLNSNGSTITNIMASYVKHTIDMVGGFSNVIWEVMLEGPFRSTNFQHMIIQVVKTYEGTGGRLVHPIGYTSFLDASDTNQSTMAHLTYTNLPVTQIPDYICPTGYNTAYSNNPPALALGASFPNIPVVILDLDHIAWTIYQGDADYKVQAGRNYAWQAFTRGYGGLLFMDSNGNQHAGYGFPLNTNMQFTMGNTQSYAQRMSLLDMTADTVTCSTGYCMTNKWREVLAFNPTNTMFTVNLPSGNYVYEWFDVVGKSIGPTGSLVSTGIPRSFAVPSGYFAASLYLKPVAGGTGTATSGITKSLVPR